MSESFHSFLQLDSFFVNLVEPSSNQSSLPLTSSQVDITLLHSLILPSPFSKQSKCAFTLNVIFEILAFSFSQLSSLSQDFKEFLHFVLLTEAKLLFFSLELSLAECSTRHDSACATSHQSLERKSTWCDISCSCIQSMIVLGPEMVATFVSTLVSQICVVDTIFLINCC